MNDFLALQLATAVLANPMDHSLVIPEHDHDVDSALLTIRLALDDINQLQAVYPGKARADTALPDAQLALEYQAESLRALLSSLEDRKMALSFQQAISDDSVLIETFARLDRVEADDLHAAQALEQNQSLPAVTNDQKWLENRPSPTA
jgi:hypothetical protein